MLGRASASQPVGDVEHVHLREGEVVGLAAVRVLVGAEPERLYRRHADFAGPADVFVQAITDEERLVRVHAERLERALEDRGMRLALAELGREDGEVDALGDPELLEIAVQQPAGVERVRDDAESQPPPAQRLEQRVCRRAEYARGRPRRVLGVEEATELLVRDLDPKMIERLAHEARVLDLVERAGHPEERYIALAEVGRVRLELGKAVAFDRFEARARPGFDELLVVPKLHESVAPIE